MADRHGCSERIYSGYEMHYCSRRGVIEDGGKWYCKQHSPEAVAKRRQASRDKYQARWDAIDAAERRRRAGIKARKRAMEALLKISNGARHPERIARQALKELEDAGA